MTQLNKSEISAQDILKYNSLSKLIKNGGSNKQSIESKLIELINDEIKDINKIYKSKSEIRNDIIKILDHTKEQLPLIINYIKMIFEMYEKDTSIRHGNKKIYELLNNYITYAEVYRYSSHINIIETIIDSVAFEADDTMVDYIIPFMSNDPRMNINL